ncbi:carbohydrate ABC transporter permease [Frankia sp. AgB32]|uniref:carbohydrate ABC transporter permease n=1 Tax=Frankia sp. AgB32 TaxID=631119 RepID=UPI0020104579|nr:sugar ABC transporter permease [Frankia sp. AgB32]MCK9897348.1 sugar ABC transporter permease [Frankia sp. AgB32]
MVTGIGTRSGPWAYSAPAILSLLAWVYVPMVATGVASLLDWNLTTPARFVGLANYRRLLADHDFYRALWQTGSYVIMMLPLATAVPLALAIALWLRPGRASRVYRALLFLPVVLAPAANAVSWQFILNPLQGVTNAVLVGVGLPGPGWLNDPSWAPLVIVAITTGKIVGLNTLLFSASLSAIDLSTIEVARIDGATSWEIVRYVVVPQLVRPVALLGLLCVLLAGQWIFTNVALVTQGGPDGSTDNAFYRIYTYAFTFFDTGTAAAAAVVITGGVAIGYAAVRLVTGRIRRAGAPAAG